MIAFDYSKFGEAELLRQIDARKQQGSTLFEGMTEKTPKLKMVRALTADDEAHRENLLKENQALSPVQIPVIDPTTAKLVEQPAPPSLEQYKSHAFLRSTNEKFAVARHIKLDENGKTVPATDQYGRTISCLNSNHFWQGTDDEFYATFREVINSETGQPAAFSVVQSAAA